MKFRIVFALLVLDLLCFAISEVLDVHNQRILGIGGDVVDERDIQHYFDRSNDDKLSHKPVKHINLSNSYIGVSSSLCSVNGLQTRPFEVESDDFGFIEL